MKQPAIKTLRKKADALWSRLIRARDGACRRCGRQPDEIILQAAHVISRRYKAIRWDERNGVALCVGCHHFAHMQPVEWDWAVQELIGVDVYQALRKEAIAYTGELKRIDLSEVIARLEKRLEELEDAA
jgi:hypothetical protein